jgi:hypothetical protein
MKINECGINMTVKAKKDISRQIKKGDEVKIRYIKAIPPFIDIDNGEVVVTEIDPKYFEPISKFEIGDKVIWNKTKVEIWGKHFEEDKSEFEYSFKYKKSAWCRGIEYESYLSPLKKINELEKGDKFEIETATGITERIYEVLAAAKCKRINRVKYFSKEIKGDSIGYVGTFIADDIKKIIY